MARRRMFSMDIIDTDHFLEMPMSTQLLYFHLSMRADDDGFVSSPKRILRLIGVAEDDFKMLLAKEYIIPFQSGVCVIKHWKIHNYIRSDRYKETIYKQEKELLIEEDNVYQLPDNGIPNVIPDDIPTVSTGKVRLGKVRLGKVSKEYIPHKEIITHLNSRANTKYRHSTPKTKDLIDARCNEGFTLDDFKTVIDKKCKEWKGTEFEQYLRPQTLFGTKFESYLNQKVGSKIKSDINNSSANLEGVDEL